MSVPASDIFAQNLYELPECSICLIQLSKELVVLNCGHCFHFHCIMQHFQLRELCPNCQQKSSRKQAINLHYRPLLKKTNGQTSSGLKANKQTQQTQMRHMAKLVKNQSDELKKLKIQKNELELQLRIRQHAQASTISIINKQREEIIVLKKQNQQLVSTKDHFYRFIERNQFYEQQMKVKISQLQEKLKDYEVLHKYEKVMGSSAQITKLKLQMERNNVIPLKRAQEFYQICMVLKLEEAKKNRKITDLQQQLKQREQKCKRILQQNEDLERQVMRLFDIKIAEMKQQDQRKKKEKPFELTDSQEQNNRNPEVNHSTLASQNNKTKKSKATRKKDDRIHSNSMK